MDADKAGGMTSFSKGALNSWKKQPAKRKILRIGRIPSVPFWAQNARNLPIFS